MSSLFVIFTRRNTFDVALYIYTKLQKLHSKIILSRHRTFITQIIGFKQLQKNKVSKIINKIFIRHDLITSGLFSCKPLLNPIWIDLHLNLDNGFKWNFKKAPIVFEVVFLFSEIFQPLIFYFELNKHHFFEIWIKMLLKTNSFYAFKQTSLILEKKKRANFQWKSNYEARN